MVLHIGKRYTDTIFSASPILTHITNNLGSSGSKTFLQNPRSWRFNIKKDVQRRNTRAILAE
jgi:hypothetical protein